MSNHHHQMDENDNKHVMYVSIFIFWHVSDISVEAINLTYMIMKMV